MQEIKALLSELDGLRKEIKEESWAEYHRFIIALKIAYPALRAHIEKLEREAEAGSRIMDAWNNHGPHPAYHKAAKQNLKKEWPTLYNSLAAYHSVTRDITSKE